MVLSYKNNTQEELCSSASGYFLLRGEGMAGVATGGKGKESKAKLITLPCLFRQNIVQRGLWTMFAAKHLKTASI